MMGTFLASVEWIVLLVGVLTGFFLWRRYPDSDSVVLRVPLRKVRVARVVFLGLACLWVGVSAVLVVLDAMGVHESADSLIVLVLGILFLGSTHLGLKTLGLAATAESLVWGHHRIPWASVREMSFVHGHGLRIATHRKAPKMLRDSSNPTVWRFDTTLLDIRQEHVRQLDRIRGEATGAA